MFVTFISSNVPGSNDDRHTHTRTHTHAWLLAQSYIHLVVRSSFTLIGAFSLHAYSVTRNFRTYFTNVGRVFLVETVVLQTVRRNIWAWSARFLVGFLFSEFFRLAICQMISLFYNLWYENKGFVIRVSVIESYEHYTEDKVTAHVNICNYA